MLAPPREHTGLFVPLAARDIGVLAEDEERLKVYLEALTYMQDLVCPYWDHPEPSRFSPEDAIIDLGRIEETHFASEASLDRHVRENSETAKTLSREGRIVFEEGAADERENLKRDATSFMKGLLFTYNQVRTI